MSEAYCEVWRGFCESTSPSCSVVYVTLCLTAASSQWCERLQPPSIQTTLVFSALERFVRRRLRIGQQCIAVVQPRCHIDNISSHVVWVNVLVWPRFDFDLIWPASGKLFVTTSWQLLCLYEDGSALVCSLTFCESVNSGRRVVSLLSIKPALIKTYSVICPQQIRGVVFMMPTSTHWTMTTYVCIIVCMC